MLCFAMSHADQLITICEGSEHARSAHPSAACSNVTRRDHTSVPPPRRCTTVLSRHAAAARGRSLLAPPRPALSITQFGGVADGQLNNFLAIRRALAACTQAGIA